LGDSLPPEGPNRIFARCNRSGQMQLPWRSSYFGLVEPVRQIRVKIIEGGSVVVVGKT
jgi:hypothetical protein